MTSSAYISPNGRYRYWLRRTWGPDLATFIMLNPSTADAAVDDPTIRRCVGFARAWGLGGIHVVNLYALRSTDPKGLWVDPDPVGPENDDFLARAFAQARASRSPVVGAWGANARSERVERVLELARTVDVSIQALAVTGKGQPRHPLYLKGDLVPVDWP